MKNSTPIKLAIDNSTKSALSRFIIQCDEIRGIVGTATAAPTDYGLSVYEPRGVVAPPITGGMRVAA